MFPPHKTLGTVSPLVQFFMLENGDSESLSNFCTFLELVSVRAEI